MPRPQPCSLQDLINTFLSLLVILQSALQAGQPSHLPVNPTLNLYERHRQRLIEGVLSIKNKGLSGKKKKKKRGSRLAWFSPPVKVIWDVQICSLKCLWKREDVSLLRDEKALKISTHNVCEKLHLWGLWHSSRDTINGCSIQVTALCRSLDSSRRRVNKAVLSLKKKKKWNGCQVRDYCTQQNTPVLSSEWFFKASLLHHKVVVGWGDKALTDFEAAFVETEFYCLYPLNSRLLKWHLSVMWI